MQLTKHHGLGNDFLVTFVDALPDGAAATAASLCDRHRGVGADGLVFGLDPAAGPVLFRLFNADGSPAEVSGNGLRCFAQALASRRGTASLDEVIDTVAGPRRVTLRATEDPHTVEVAVAMGIVGEGPGVRGDLADVPGLPPVQRAATADIGNPHLVLLVDDPDTADLALLGPALEVAYGGINVHLVAPEGDGLHVRTWERGAGATLACGSGACVSAARAHDWGLVGDEVAVRMPGGTARVHLGEQVTLLGPSTFVATIEVPHVGT